MARQQIEEGFSFIEVEEPYTQQERWGPRHKEFKTTQQNSTYEMTLEI